MGGPPRGPASFDGNEPGRQKSGRVSVFRSEAVPGVSLVEEYADRKKHGQAGASARLHCRSGSAYVEIGLLRARIVTVKVVIKLAGLVLPRFSIGIDRREFEGHAHRKFSG